MDRLLGFLSVIRTYFPTSLETWTFIALVATTLATVAMASFTWFLARIGRTQIEHTQILQRAYISVNPSGIDTNTYGQQIGHVIFDNAGHLPARDFHWRININTFNAGNW